MNSERKIIKINKVDKVVKDKIEPLNFQSPPIEDWDRKSTWLIIKSKLNGQSKTFIMWGVSIAASVSMLIAANLSFDLDHFEIQESKEKIEASASPLKEFHKTEQQINDSRPVTLLSGIKTKYLEEYKDIVNYPVAIDDNQIAKKTYQSDISPVLLPKNNSFISPYAALGYSSNQGATPEFGLDFQLWNIQKDHISNIIYLGASSRFQIVGTETGNRIEPFAFVNVGYSRINRNNDKGWNLQASVLVNPDGQVYKNHTSRISFNKRFNKHIKAGPELIFTNNYGRIYPGITIVFS